MRTLAIVCSWLVGSAALADQATPDPSAGDEQAQTEDGSEAAELAERGIPMPPTQERRAYRTWRNKLPRKVQRKLERYCRSYGGESRAACNGIGPHGIPSPPPVTMPSPTGRTADAGYTRVDWEASLTPVQRQYLRRYCSGEDTAFTELCGGTPLVLAFDDEPVAYTAGIETDWPTARTPWLVLDRDGDGAITRATELFGSATQLASGRAAKHGFEALAELDTNHDGVIDGRDPSFATLRVWADHDADRRSTPDELSPLSAQVTSISLSYRRVPACTNGNCEGERSTMTWRDADGSSRTGSVVDVYLKYR